MAEIGTAYGSAVFHTAALTLQATPVGRTEEKISPVYGPPSVSRVSSSEVQPSVLGRDDELRNKEKKTQERGETSGKKRPGPSRRMDEILFAYNFRGDLRIKYMDSLNELIYQTPPVLLARISDLMATTAPVDVTI